VLVIEQPLKFSGLLLLIGGTALLTWVGARILRSELARANAKKATVSITKDI